jgi:hypothetical protein
MTRQQIKTFCQDLLGEQMGMPGAENPFAWDLWISTAADDVARATDCFAVTAGTDLVARQALYPAPTPSIYRQDGAYWTDETQEVHELIAITTTELDIRRPLWRNDEPGDPQFVVILGTQQILIYPTPDFSSLVWAYTDLVVQANAYQVSSAARPFEATDAGYTLRMSAAPDSGVTAGIYTVIGAAGGVATLDRPVGTAGTTGGTGALSLGGLFFSGLGLPGSTWPNPGDACPLPDYEHMSVAYRAALLRILQRPTQENAARRSMLEQEWARARGKVERTVVEATEATRNADRMRLLSTRYFYY